MGCLAWCLAAHANEPTQARDPYTAIAKRNIFHLVLPQTKPIVSPTNPPPKLLPDGIINIFGRAQVLFKVDAHTNSPGSRPKESSYILAEGEQCDGVRVMQIDITNAVVTFNNHGTVQQIPLAKPPVVTAETKPRPTPAQILFQRFGRRG